MPGRGILVVCILASTFASSALAQAPDSVSRPPDQLLTAPPIPVDFTQFVQRFAPSLVGVTTRAVLYDLEREGILDDDGSLREFLRRGRERSATRQRHNCRRGDMPVSGAEEIAEYCREQSNMRTRAMFPVRRGETYIFSAVKTG